MAFVYYNSEGDREEELGADAYRSTDKEFVYNAEDRDNAATAAVAYKVKGTDVVIEFDKDNVRYFFTRIGIFQPYDIRDLV